MPRFATVRPMQLTNRFRNPQPHALPVHVTFSEYCIRFGRSFDIGHIAVVVDHESGAAPATRKRAA